MKTSAIVIIVIIVVALVCLVWYLNASSPVQNTAQPTGQSNQVNPTISSNSSAGDVSDASLNQDLSDIDNQISGLASDSTSADQSISTNQTAGQ